MTVTFGEFLLDRERGLLFRGGEPMTVTPKAIELLSFFTAHPGELLTKDELLAAIWPDTVADENNLTQLVSVLRKALGDSAAERRYIVTVPGRGYRFVAAIASAGDPPPLAAEPAPRPRVLAIAAAVVLAVALSVLASLRIDAALRPKRTIAVLPFSSLSGEPHDTLLGAQIADVLATELARRGELRVRPTSVVQRYCGLRDAVSAGRALGVDAVIEGRVQREGNVVRIAVQLVDVPHGVNRWSAKYDLGCPRTLRIQDRVSELVAPSIADHL